MGGEPSVERRGDAFYFHQIYYRGFGAAEKGIFRQAALKFVKPSFDFVDLAFTVGKNTFVHRFKVENVTDIYAVEPSVMQPLRVCPEFSAK